MDNPPRIPAQPRYHDDDERQNKNRKPVAQLKHKNHSSHKTKVTIITQSPNEIADQVIYPLPQSPSSNISPPSSGSVGSDAGTQASESGCSAQTQKTGTTTTANLVLMEDGIEYYKNGKYANAMKSFNSVLKSQMFRRAEDDNPILANVLANIGSVYLRQDRYDHAIESLENAARMMRRSKINHETKNDQQIVPTDVPLAGVLNNLGTAKFLEGDHKASLECYWQAIRDAKTNNSGSNTKEVANSLYNIGRISVLQKDYSMALNTLNKSLSLEKKLCGKQNIEVVDTLNLIGFVHYSTGDFDLATKVFTEALSIVTACFGSIHEKVAVSIVNVGMVLEKEGDLVEALRCFSTARDVCEKVGLDERNSTMHTAIRSTNDIRRQLSLAQNTEPSERNKGQRDTRGDIARSTFHQSRKTSPFSRPIAGAAPQNKAPCLTTRDEDKQDMNTYAAFKARRNSEQATIEYREEQHWEFDDSSMVEEDREG